ncbi:MAG: dihydropyrimidinase [Desulfobacteraceae bacterium]|nr:dihydropyrimidinase [Desulfobacteraceae bacterium]
MEQVLIKNALIVTENKIIQGEMLIEDGVIARLGENLKVKAAREFDADGKYVLPGGIDVHTHLSLSAGKAKVMDGFYTGTAAAAFGGTTCIVEHPGFGPPGCSLMHQVQSCLSQARGQAVVDFALHGVFQHTSEQIFDEIQTLTSAGVSSAKIYMTYDGRLSDSQILQVMARAGKQGLLIAFHAENHAIIQFLNNRFRSQGKREPIYHALSRPDYCETDAIERIINLALTAGDIPVYIVHLSTAAGLAAIEAARRKGRRVFAEVCPQHLLLDDTCYQEPNHGGLKYIMAPPARKQQDCEALWAGVFNGAVNVVATDHCAFSFKDKLALGKHDYNACPGGIPGVETRLPLLFSEAVVKRGLDITRFVDLVSTQPAKIMGLYPRKGALLVGADADIIIFDPEKEKTITPANLYHPADYSAYEGLSVRGWPVLTMVRGCVVMQQDKLTAPKGWGEYIYRQLLQ